MESFIDSNTLANQIGPKDLFGIAYVSRREPQLDEAELQLIQHKSLRFNTENQITGVLIVDDSWIIQVLEGRHDDVSALMNTIEEDPRHREVRRFSSGKLAERVLPNWEMTERLEHEVPKYCHDKFARLAEVLWRVELPLRLTPERILNIYRLAKVYAAPHQHLRISA